MMILRGALPPPVSDDPADRVRRDRAAMAAVGALLPVNAAEGRLAAQFVVADAWAMDCLRLAGEKRREIEVSRKCRAQAMSLMREGKGSLRLLLRLQAARQAVEKDAAAASRAEWAEHSALGMMQEALSEIPAKSEAPAALSPASAGGDEARQASSGGEWKFRSAFVPETESFGASIETDERLGPDAGWNVC